ncbi:DUF6582 domain-containing protein [Kitasatospora cathayae]|uniref:Uncharacterized protein n=1 Tax=Kitasatospora cathayae TaxID=3004092 RepID=A0ABY7QAG8_9ACTN|nr:DUF6582 domain-containing protein [Kitasatospora sp. HUAS 3-15]WBP89531.1 hypothetical protein O1G21_29280 [Kitasatospora sp. HUAS 3-15]
MAAIATIRGTAIAPGVSRNGRLYTAEMLARSAERAQAAIDRGEPHTMLTHHGAEDDSTRIVGRVTKLERQDDGRVTFEAEIADTAHGRDIAALVTGDQPFLDGVSIRGAWRGRVRRIQHEGQTVETADDLDLFGLDFTKTPGVALARIERSTAPTESAEPSRLVYESVSEATAAKVKAPYGAVKYADPGYRASVKRYPIDTVKHARAAWSYINKPSNADDYTPQQLKRIRSRIKAALKKFGVTVSETTSFGDVTEFYGDEPTGMGGGFCIDAQNGPISVTIRCCGIDPAELRVIAAAAMDAAVDALQCLDPDMDADIDVPGAPHADSDGDMESRPGDDQMETVVHALTAKEAAAVQAAGFPSGTFITRARVAEALALAETAPAIPAGVPIPTQEVPAVSEPTPAVETASTPPTITLTAEQFQQLLDRTAPTPATETAPPAPAVEPVEETDEQRIARIVAERLAAEREQLVESLRAEVRQNGPARKGMRTETPGGAAVGEPSPDEIRRNTNEALLSWVSNGRYTLND